jgi:hypothetical protein
MDKPILGLSMTSKTLTVAEPRLMHGWKTTWNNRDALLIPDYSIIDQIAT